MDSDMKQQTCLHKRGATYYFRRRIPQELLSFDENRVRDNASKVRDDQIQSRA